MPSVWAGSRYRAGKRCREESESESDEPSLPTRDANRIYFHCDVNKKTVLQLTRLINECAAESAGKVESPVVWIFIHSNGGDLHAGISAMGCVQRFRGTIKTVADGFVASAATLILLAGRDRYIVPHSRVLIHQLRTGFEGKYFELADEYSNSASLMSTIISIYESHTDMPPRFMETCLKGEKCCDELQCLKYGIVDRVLR